MSAARARAWRIVELAAKIAQEDEAAAIMLFQAAANASPDDSGQYDRGVRGALHGLASAMVTVVEREKQERARTEGGLVK